MEWNALLAAGGVEGTLLLAVGAILALAVVSALAANRAGVPLLVGFLAVGMLLGSDGPGGIDFDDPDLARVVGVAGLVAILFEGGLTSAWRGIRPVLVTAALLGTLGVVVTAAVVGVAAAFLFDLSAANALLLGAVVGSTDAAAVFATLRFTTLRRRIARLLEAESGVNDPTAVALTIGLIEWIQHDDFRTFDLSLLLVQHLALGLVGGIVLGFASAWLFARLPQALAPFASVASLAIAALSFGIVAVIGGSGFLSVYIVGLILGNTHAGFRRPIVAFHQSLAFVAQVVLFVVLGLLVFPSDLLGVVLPGVALSLFLILVARPLAVWASTLFQGFGRRERAIVGWAGLRGAVPIVLATFALSEGIGESDTIFNAVFFVVVVSTLIQGPTLEPLARRLGLARAAGPVYRPPITVDEGGAVDLFDFGVEEPHAVAGRFIRDLDLPRNALIVVIMRGEQVIPPRGNTRVEPGDRLYVLADPEAARDVEAAFAQWSTATR